MLTSCPSTAVAPFLGPLLHWERLMASLAKLSTSWSRSSVKVPFPFWVWEITEVGTVACDSETQWSWEWLEPFALLVSANPEKQHKWARRQLETQVTTVSRLSFSRPAVQLLRLGMDGEDLNCFTDRLVAVSDASAATCKASAADGKLCCGEESKAWRLWERPGGPEARSRVNKITQYPSISRL